MEHTMFDRSRLLRIALLADAASSGAMGVLLAAGATFLEPWLGLPATLLRPLGLALLPFAAFVAWLGLRERPTRGLVWTVVAVNAVWVLDSLLLLVWPGLSPTLLGQAFVAAQGLAVAALTLVQGGVLASDNREGLPSRSAC
jgi:hypothetical protein